MAEQELKKGILIEEDHVECRPDQIPAAIADENVDVCLVRSHFTHDAWLLVEDVVKAKNSNMSWTCNVCYHDLHADTSGPSIVCESCLKWFHFTCVGLQKQPKAKNWFCRPCYSAVK